METADHMLTPSYGIAGAEYRALQAEMIAKGQYLDALKMDVDFIQKAFPRKYDSAIQQMGEHVWQLGANW